MGILFAGCAAVLHAATVLVEAEGFDSTGGWVIDQQSMDQMGSPYLMAHGLGVPVADAVTRVAVPEAGRYRVWVRTRDWVATWRVPGAPGKFKVLVNDRPLEPLFGAQGAAWHWQDGGMVELRAGQVSIALRDLTGFNGRCDAILLATDLEFRPPDGGPELAALRRRLLALPESPDDAGSYDLVVVGGGMAGCCAAVSAARLGCKVALIQDRPVLGGNNSSEVRVGLSGQIHQEPYPRLGDLVDEIGPIGHWNLHDAKRHPDLPRSKEVLAVIKRHPEKKIHNAGPASNYEDKQKLRVVTAETNLVLALNTRVIAVEKEGKRVTAVIGRDIVTGRDKRFCGALFADCTGDGCVGFLAGADFREGRESKGETGESLAPEKADRLMMGVSVQWYSEVASKPMPFPECPWALAFTPETAQPLTRGDWDWEAGLNMSSVTEIEQIRDHALRATFGNWAFVRNQSDKRAEFANRRLVWVAYIGGKRESRRLLGDVILQQQDIETGKAYPDACVTTTWGIDLHYPHPENSRHFPGMEFRAVSKTKSIKPYAIPYRCLYSRSLDNLFMAGRNISVTHVALGSVRVMRTGGMMGEVVGMSAALCTRHGTTPRGVFEAHLPALQEQMRRGVGRFR
ncbi:MAG TPA: FAD-dependent oxidoreductase [Kiritimatiellia bacterium]|jgi:hypothetical protein|nr:FAD-dependent oxidoreductase [Kiritimatiellia bacterium]